MTSYQNSMRQALESRKFLRKFRHLARFKFTANRVTDEEINDPFGS